MIINDKMRKELLKLIENIELIIKNNSLTDLQLENFLRSFEGTRYNLLNEIKQHNKNVKYEYEKVKTIDNEYKIEFSNNILKIYVPEPMPSYKNMKTHAHKRILLNIAEGAKKYENLFKNEVFIYIKIFDKILGWDVDNRCIKPIADALILSKVIQDDNMTKMSYCVKGEYSEKPHTEIFVFDNTEISNFLHKYSI